MSQILWKGQCVVCCLEAGVGEARGLRGIMQMDGGYRAGSPLANLDLGLRQFSNKLSNKFIIISSKSSDGFGAGF